MKGLIESFANATATFYAEQVVEEEDPHGDPVETTEWVSTHEDVPIRYQSDHAETQGHVIGRNVGGDTESPDPLIFIPPEVGHDHSDGDRVTIEYLGEATTMRIVSFDHHTLDFGDEGYAMARLADWGDDMSG